MYMVFLQRVLDLISSNGITKNKLLTNIKINKNSFVDWDRNKTIPSAEVVAKIADYFHVSTDYLLGRTDDPRPVEEIRGPAPVAESGPMYPSEYDLLSPEDQALVDNMICSLSKKRQTGFTSLHIPPKDKTDSEMVKSDEDIDREVEDYRRRLILEKSQEAGSSPSNGAGSETA